MASEGPDQRYAACTPGSRGTCGLGGSESTPHCVHGPTSSVALAIFRRSLPRLCQSIRKPMATDRPFRRSKRLPAEAYSTAENTFHLVCRVIPGAPVFHGAYGDAEWHIVDAEFDIAGAHVLAACLMPDHLHVLAAPGDRPLTV